MNIDPVPFISMAFGAAILLLGSYTFWTISQRAKLRVLARTFNTQRGGA